MLHDQQQSTMRVDKPPTWWLDGEPRFHDFRPTEFPVATTCLLLRTECQGCGRDFDLAVRTDRAPGRCLLDWGGDGDGDARAQELTASPPAHVGGCGCDCIGSSLPGHPKAVLQCWTGGPSHRTRRLDLEGRLPE